MESTVNEKPSTGDLLMLLLLGLVGFLVAFLGPTYGHRTFPLWVPGGNGAVYPQYAYPLRQQIVGTPLAAALVIVIPAYTILMAQLLGRRCRNRSNVSGTSRFWDASNGLLGLAYALLATIVFCTLVKWLIGGLRPWFYAACRPDPQRMAAASVGYHGQLSSTDVCKQPPGPLLYEAMHSFPSGHAAAFAASAVYLSLYLWGKLSSRSAADSISNTNPLNINPVGTNPVNTNPVNTNINNIDPTRRRRRRMAGWKLVAVLAPILLAVLGCGALLIDHSHHWYDIVVGIAIGTVIAWLAYKMFYDVNGEPLE
ncbi:phosphatidic acid phosphatase type 2/haloperoxidase [Xylariaceae sp. FL0804]|nr:phosphatidic acid phosphatase type 2/haloperoxidase [Xylariaceae sp. FL0804]